MKTIVVFGATGQQGSSVINFILNSPLQSEYSIRAITRDATRPAAQELSSKGIEVVEADSDSPSSLPAALHNAHTVFIVTTTEYGPNLEEIEYRQGTGIADAAVAAGAKYLIFSSLVNTSNKVVSFDSKAKVEDYIRNLPVASAFFDPGMFMQNFATAQKPRPTNPDATEFAIACTLDPDVKIPLIDIVSDTGKYVGAILSNPDKYAGKTFHAASGLYSFQEIVDIISKVSGKKVNYFQVPGEEYAKYLPENMAQTLVKMLDWINSPGYFGEGTEELVEESMKDVDRLNTLEEFVRENDLFSA